MKQDTTQEITAASSRSGRYALRSIWQIQTAKGEGLWTWITWAFAAYWTLFVAGAFLNRKELNVVGGVVILGVLALTLFERLWVRLDGVVIASLLAAGCVPLLQSLVSTPPSPEALFKHISLCLVMAMARPLQLPATSRCKIRGALATQVLLILFISVTIFKGSSWDGGTRHSGLFVNPNNLALIPFLLLFFIDERKDRWFIRLGAHGVVVTVLAFSGTSGAVLAYAIGLAIHFSSMVSKAFRSLASALTVFVLLAGVTFVAMDGERFLPQTRMIHQIAIMRTEFKDVIDGANIQYYEKEKVLGSGSGSGIWRLMHWRKTITTYLDGTPAQQIFGFGIGSSPVILGVLPHNEYLRILFEQGIVGFLLFIFAWKRIIMTAPAEVRYIGLITAIYSFSENNLDNFPFMALFILCLSARGVGERLMSAAAGPQTTNTLLLERTPASLPLLGC
jgi:hypothetical protein